MMDSDTLLGCFWFISWVIFWSVALIIDRGYVPVEGELFITLLLMPGILIMLTAIGIGFIITYIKEKIWQ